MRNNVYKTGPDGRKVSHDGFKTSSYTWMWPKPQCVAVKIENDAVYVRDTKDVAGTTLKFTPGEWDAFIKGVKAGEFDI